MRTVPLDDVSLPTWGWHLANDTQDEKLRVSLETYGQLTPILVRQVDGQYEVIDGRRRVLLLRELGRADVWVHHVGTITDDDAIRLAMSLELGSEIDFARLAPYIKQVYTPGLWQLVPFTDERLGYMITLCDLDWDQYRQPMAYLFEEGEEEDPPYTPD